MNKDQAKQLVRDTFTHGFQKDQFRRFMRELLNRYDESKANAWNKQFIPNAFKEHIDRYERLGTYTSPGDDKVDILIVHLTQDSKLERARTSLRNFVAHHLKSRDEKDSGLVAFVSPTEQTWRFSFVKMEYETTLSDSGRVSVSTNLTPARRFSYLVGEGESCHTAQTRFLEVLKETNTNPTLGEIAECFSVETVTKEFFTQYYGLFQSVKTALEKITAKDKGVRGEFSAKRVGAEDFAKKLLGQIVFLYFIQKKGWLGVERGHGWGSGPHNFVRRLAGGDYGKYRNFFNDILEPLFYDTLATDRGPEAWCETFKARIPFLNGGLFEPLGGYDWKATDLIIPNELFFNTEGSGEGDIGTGILDVFDRYNFTVNESEPLEQEVAIDPEMLGKVFENLIEENLRKGTGAFYTPREIVHYMCQETLISYLSGAVNKQGVPMVAPKAIQDGLFGHAKPVQGVLELPVSRDDLGALVHLGDQAAHYEAAFKAGTTSYEKKDRPRLPKAIEGNARKIDEALRDITVCDPAIGSGAFPVGMMTEIVRARLALNPYFVGEEVERTAYHFKRQAIHNCMYGVDIDRGAVEIARLRLWLSLVVDEEDVKEIKPLPNLDFKVVPGNSLLGFLFHSHGLAEIEQLKEQYFDEPDHGRKAELKEQIDRQIEARLAESERTLGYRVDFDFRLFFSEVFRTKGGFDVVIANPPYVGESGHKELFRITKSGPLGQFYLGKMDYFYFFFHLALQLSRVSGEIAFITTNYYPTATGARKLRAHFKSHGLIRRLVDFSELRIFESAQGQHNMLTLLRNGRGDESTLTCVTSRRGQATPDILARILRWDDPESQYFEVSQEALYDGPENYIRLTRAKAAKGAHGRTIDTVLDKIAAAGRPLVELAHINQGVVSGMDYVSSRNEERVPNSAVKGDGVFVFDLNNARDRDVVNGFSEKEKGLLRRFYKNSDIARYACSTETSKRLLYIGREQDSLDACPQVKKHLAKFKEALSERREVENGVIKYFQLQWPRTESIFVGEKIVIPYRSEENAFAFNRAEWFCRSDCYIITKKDTGLDLMYLLALLNSTLYFQWLYHRGKRKGRMLEMFQIPLSEIPIKRISREEQKPFVELATRITQAKRKDAGEDTGSLEARVDELVNKLYGLSSAEIDLVMKVAEPGEVVPHVGTGSR